MSFKLIAIRPLTGIAPKYLKNLHPGEVYNLCNDYTLVNRHGKSVSLEEDVYTIEHKQTVPENLYSITKINGETININVSAVVGKNGAGKSSLLDLLLLSIFVVSYNQDFVIPENFIESAKSNLEPDEINNFNNELDEIKTGLKVEIYYLQQSKYYRLTINRGKF